MVPINKADSLGRFESNLISVLAAVETSFKPIYCSERNSPRQGTYLNLTGERNMKTAEIAEEIYKAVIASQITSEVLHMDIEEVRNAFGGFAILSIEAAEALTNTYNQREYEKRSVLNASLKEIQASLK